jgi:hypothetical protein
MLIAPGKVLRTREDVALTNFRISSSVGLIIDSLRQFISRFNDVACLATNRSAVARGICCCLSHELHSPFLPGRASTSFIWVRRCPSSSRSLLVSALEFLNADRKSSCWSHKAVISPARTVSSSVELGWGTTTGSGKSCAGSIGV